MAQGDIWELVMRGQCLDQQILNVYHFFEAATASAPELVPPAFAAAAYEFGAAGFDSVLPTEVTFPEASMQRIHPTLGSSILVPLTGIQGNQSASPMMNVAAVVTWRTPLGGRSRRGRSYIGPVAEAAYQDGEILAAPLANVQAGADQAILQFGPTQGAGLGYILSVWSTVLNVATGITGATARRLARSQRRRNIGIGA
jgi:hypothetical protein